MHSAAKVRCELRGVCSKQFTGLVCWATPVSVRVTRGRSLRASTTSHRPSIAFRPGRRVRRPLRLLRCADEEPVDKDEGAEGSEGSGGDWDSYWKDYREKRESGGVFTLPPDEGEQSAKKDGVDERVDRLTSAWSNDKGFLAGIGVIGLIALFYVYVYVSGGISH